MVAHVTQTRQFVMTQLIEPCCTVKGTVQEKYDAIARGQRDPCYCMVEQADYRDKTGYQEDADLGLGCGTPVDHAELQFGEIVLDLGCGAGLDAMIAAPLVGAKGEIMGVDFTPSMVARAKRNASAVGVDNVVFLEGDIEQLPIEDSSIDVVISNCTINLVPNKAQVYAEIFRVLRPGGRFIISDVVTVGSPDPELLRRAEEAAGCVAGAAEKESYMQLIAAAGLKELEVVQFRSLKVISEQDGLASITVRGRRL